MEGEREEGKRREGSREARRGRICRTNVKLHPTRLRLIQNPAACKANHHCRNIVIHNGRISQSNVETMLQHNKQVSQENVSVNSSSDQTDPTKLSCLQVTTL